jgi:hypothetical protein
MAGEVKVTDSAEEAAVTDLAGEVEDTLLSVVVVTHLADSPAVALVRDSAGRGDFLLVDFLVAERKPTRTGQVPFLNSGEFSWRSPRFS